MSDQQPTLPLHPSLAPLNLPPLPWGLHNLPASIAIADANRTEVLYVSGFPDLDVTGLHLGYIERQDTAVIAIANVVATSPDVLNAALIAVDWWLSEAGGIADMKRGRAAFADLQQAIARALGQEGGSHE